MTEDLRKLLQQAAKAQGVPKVTDGSSLTVTTSLWPRKSMQSRCRAPGCTHVCCAATPSASSALTSPPLLLLQEVRAEAEAHKDNKTVPWKTLKAVRDALR